MGGRSTSTDASSEAIEGGSSHVDGVIVDGAEFDGWVQSAELRSEAAMFGSKLSRDEAISHAS